MNNELIKPKSWWNRNWKWFVPIIGLVLISVIFIFTTGLSGIASDFAQAYSETELYENAIEKVNSEPKIEELLGEIEPIDKLAILEGEVRYSNANKTVNSTVKIIGSKGKANMDISADKIDGEWNYTKIDVRIKKPADKKQTIEIYSTE